MEGLKIDVITEDRYVCFFKIFVLLYADDTVIMTDNADSFQICLDSFYHNCTECKLKINKYKSNVIVFGARKTFNFRICDTILEIVDSYKYLGTYFSKLRSFLNARKPHL